MKVWGLGGFSTATYQGCTSVYKQPLQITVYTYICNEHVIIQQHTGCTPAQFTLDQGLLPLHLWRLATESLVFSVSTRNPKAHILHSDGLRGGSRLTAAPVTSMPRAAMLHPEPFSSNRLKQEALFTLQLNCESPTSLSPDPLYSSLHPLLPRPKASCKVKYLERLNMVRYSPGQLFNRH